MKEVSKGSSLNEHRQEKEYGWKPIPPKKKPVRKKSEYTYAFIGILIGLFFGILTSVLMYRDSQRFNLLLEENKLLKEMLYYKKTK